MFSDDAENLRHKRQRKAVNHVCQFLKITSKMMSEKPRTILYLKAILIMKEEGHRK